MPRQRLLYESRKVFDEFPNSRDVVSWNAMLVGYVRNEQIFVAEYMFDQMPERDVISWSTLIMGYVQNGDLEKGLVLFSEMIRNGSVSVNEATLVTVLSGSAQLGLLEHGTFVHSIIKKVKFPLTLALGTALGDMYAKCGCIDLARYVFYELPKRDIFAWNAMICGVATHGQGKEALELFQRSIDEGFNPTAVTFVGILNACSRAGLVNEGRHFFNSMVRDYGIEPEMEHYGCMVDLLGRAGLVPEALELIEGHGGTTGKQEEKDDATEEMVPEVFPAIRSRFHNFSFPTMNWGCQRILRFVNSTEMGGTAARSITPDTRPRRERNAAYSPVSYLPKSPQAGGFKEKEAEGTTTGGVEKKLVTEQMNASSVAAEGAAVAPAIPWNLRKRKATCYAPQEKGIKSYRCSSPPKPTFGKDDSAKAVKRGTVVSENGQQRKYSVSLSREEIEKDIYYLFKGTKPSERPKKRPKAVQKQLDALLPGSLLAEITKDMYKTVK
ncbi:pentatricopeptide repeat-containing protein At1g31430-like isoform X2 [Dendrobium catenatum]|uniref:pentatricopeptide repeat-containing protein At1g31430-like isoform X2 n=1 Tax=Dendrobium catenatum TaxID=906689 RepID=UPI0010A010E6|nr:pentatricopeptide repeat-containing protein At1g31430-like isoform X2 [Dendrobium catenatum]